MKRSIPLLAKGSAALLLALTPLAAVHAQAVDANAVVSDHGDWTLRQREDWLKDRLDKAKDDHSIDRAEYDRVHDHLNEIRHDEDRMRDRHDGQLTDNETATLEARLDGVADQIHWLHEDAFRRPW